MPAVPAVSVVLPVRDAAATVARAVASVVAQTWRDWELVAVDDGSRDGSAEIVAAAAAADRRVRLLRQGREGIVAALNAGLAAARGGLVARMDADDVAYPERLDVQVRFLRAPEHAAVGVVGCRVEFGGERAASEGYARHVDWSNALVTPEAIAGERFVDAPLAHPSVMFRRELVARCGGYRAGEFPEDYELWLRWMDAGVRCAKVPAVLLRWSDSPGRASRTDPRYAAEAFFRVKAHWLARELARAAGGREIWVWGAGRPTRKRVAWLEAEGVRVAGFIDVDPKKWTPALGGTGRPVVGPEALPEPGRWFVLGYVSARGARESIAAALHARGYRRARDFLPCA
jgi:glycosyltransferase involved in cell wall biosynthesis